MNRNTDTSTRERILAEAARLFSEKGFDGTRVNEIAAAAGISQALIYYNFKSKQVILEEILNNFKKEMSEMFTEIYSVSDDKDIDKSWHADEIRKSIRFFMEKKHVLKILIFESVKTTTSENLLDIWDSINATVRDRLLEQRGYSIDHTDIKRNVADSFFIFLPAIFFSILERDWREEREFDEDAVYESFSHILNKIYTENMR